MKKVKKFLAILSIASVVLMPIGIDMLFDEVKKVEKENDELRKQNAKFCKQAVDSQIRLGMAMEELEYIKKHGNDKSG